MSGQPLRYFPFGDTSWEFASQWQEMSTELCYFGLTTIGRTSSNIKPGQQNNTSDPYFGKHLYAVTEAFSAFRGPTRRDKNLHPNQPRRMRNCCLVRWDICVFLSTQCFVKTTTDDDWLSRMYVMTKQARFQNGKCSTDAINFNRHSPL